MSLLTPIHFCFPSLIFGLLVAKYLAENGVSGTFWKKYWPNSFHTWHLPLWGGSNDPYIFLCSYPYFRPSGGQIFGRKWGFRNFLKKLLVPFNTYMAFTIRGWISWSLFIFVFLASFSVLWLPNIGPKMGFLELKKTIGSIHFIPRIYPDGMSLLTLTHFRVPRLFIGYFWMRWVVIRAGVYCPHLWAQLVCLLQFFATHYLPCLMGAFHGQRGNFLTIVTMSLESRHSAWENNHITTEN